MKIVVQGNSGCSLSVTRYEGRLSVVKSAMDGNYVGRLKAQIAKQKRARVALPLAFLNVPEVVAENESRSGTEHTYYAVMEYLNYQDYSDYFARVSAPALEGFVTKVIELLEYELAHSQTEAVDPALFHAKLDEIAGKLAGSAEEATKRKQLEALHQAVDAEEIRLPIGPTHGDLTLANMMISADGSRVGVFDFLDSYLDSPLVDVAKVRQDTQFFWSQLMTEEPIDTTRFHSVMGYLDGRIDHHFSRYTWYQRHYRLIQGINIARIFPYEKHPKVTQFTVNSLIELGF